MSATHESIAAGRSERLSTRDGRAHRTVAWLRKHASAVGMVLRATAARLAGRRSGEGLAVLASARAFQQEVIEAARPVLVMFYKTGCPTCVLLEPVLDQLAREYGDRIVIAKYKHLNPFFRLTSSRIMKRYRVYLVPTVMLFVNGQDRRRWFMKYCVDDYRKALDTVLDSSNPSLLAGGDEAPTEPVPLAEATLPGCCTTGGACRVKL